MTTDGATLIIAEVRSPKLHADKSKNPPMNITFSFLGVNPTRPMTLMDVGRFRVLLQDVEIAARNWWVNKVSELRKG